MSFLIFRCLRNCSLLLRSYNANGQVELCSCTLTKEKSISVLRPDARGTFSRQLLTSEIFANDMNKGVWSLQVVDDDDDDDGDNNDDDDDDVFTVMRFFCGRAASSFPSSLLIFEEAHRTYS